VSGPEPATHLLVPATLVPVATQVRLIVGHHDQMKGPGKNAQLTPGTDVLLARRIGLNRGDGHPEKIAHARTAKIATRARAIATMSATLLS